MDASGNTVLMNSAILISAGTYLVSKFQSVPLKGWELLKRKLLFTVTIEETDDLYGYFERWLKQHHGKNYRNVSATIQDKSEGVSPHHSDEIVHAVTASSDCDDEITKPDELYFWQHDDYFIIRVGKKKRRILIKKNREKLEAAKSLLSAYINRFEVSGLYAKKEIKILLEEIIEYNQQFKVGAPPKLFSNSHGYWNERGHVRSKNMKNVFIPEKELVLADIENYISNKVWYVERGIPYKRGYLFYGAAGNGKTALCLALASHFQKDIYFLSLNDIHGDEAIREAFMNMKTNSILVLEDIDAAFGDKRKAKASTSFSALLNCLDGAFYKEGIITIMTTNHKDKLDSALIRAGRIDTKIEVSNPAKKEVEDYIQLFFGDDSITIPKYNDHGIPMVDVQDLCLKNIKNPDFVIKSLTKS